MKMIIANFILIIIGISSVSSDPFVEQVKQIKNEGEKFTNQEDVVLFNQILKNKGDLKNQFKQLIVFSQKAVQMNEMFEVKTKIFADTLVNKDIEVPFEPISIGNLFDEAILSQWILRYSIEWIEKRLKGREEEEDDDIRNISNKLYKIQTDLSDAFEDQRRVMFSVDNYVKKINRLINWNRHENIVEIRTIAQSIKSIVDEKKYIIKTNDAVNKIKHLKRIIFF